MQINFRQYFQIEAAAKGNLSFLLDLDLLMANRNIDRQVQAEEKQAAERIRTFEHAVETTHRQLASGSVEPNAKAS